MIFDRIVQVTAQQFSTSPTLINVCIIAILLIACFAFIRFFRIESTYSQVLVLIAFLGFMVVDGLIPQVFLYMIALISLIAAIFKLTEGGG